MKETTTKEIMEQMAEDLQSVKDVYKVLIDDVDKENNEGKYNIAKQELLEERDSLLKQIRNKYVRPTFTSERPSNLKD